MKLKRIAVMLAVALMVSCLFTVPALANDSITISDNNCVYDGDFHGVILSGIRPSDTITYWVGGIYQGTNEPTFKNVGEHWVWVDVSRPGWNNDESGLACVRITPATITVSTPDREITYGDAAPTSFEPKYSGIAEGESVGDILSGAPNIYCNYQQFDDVGDYNIFVKKANLDIINDNYKFGCHSFKNGNLEVGKKQLTVKAQDDSVTYGDEAPDYTYSCVGFVGSDDESTVLSGTPDITCDYDQYDPVGGYTIDIDESTVTSRNSNYVLEISNGTLTVNPKTITLSANDDSVTYGDEAPDYTYLCAGFVGSDDESTVLSGTPDITCDYDQYDPVGGYTIDIDESTVTSENSNYELEINDGTLTVNPKTIKISADDDSVTYGDEAPDYTYSCAGLVGSDSESTVLSGKPFINCDYDQGDPVDDYAIELDRESVSVINSNYTLAFDDGILTVGKKALTVSARNESIIYGDDAPASYVPMYEGFIGIDNPTNSLLGSPILECDYQKGDGAGEYDITIDVNNMTSENYLIEEQSGKLLVAKETLTVTVDDKTVIFSDPVPEYTAQITGFVNGDDENCLGGACAFECCYSTTTPVGKYSITPSGYESENYDLEYVSGTLTVNQKMLNVIFNSNGGSAINPQSVGYGDLVIKPADPIKVGYSFEGWYIGNPSFKTAWNFKTDTMPLKDLALYAKWQINTFTVTFVDHDGKELNSQSVNWGTAAIAPTNPTRTGHTFTGWDKTFSNVTSDLTVTAQYKQNETVSLDDSDIPKTYDDSQAFPWWWIVVAAALIGAIVWIIVSQARKHKNTGDAV